MRLRVRPFSYKLACEYIEARHRHHKPPQGHKFSIAAIDLDSWRYVGVACVGRPVARALDDGATAEVTRLCTDGTQNACSLLYGACARICKEMGYREVITYILESESGISLKASGWEFVAKVKGQSWNNAKRPRTDKHPTCDKQRWRKMLNKEQDYYGEVPE